MSSFSSSLVTIAQAEVPPPPPEAVAEKPSAFGPEFFIAIVIFMAAFYFLIQRPQKKAEEEKKKAIEGMKKGDKVISIGGIHGKVVRVVKETDTVVVEIARGVEVEFNKTAVNAVPEKKEVVEKK